LAKRGDKVDVNYQISRSYFPYDEKSSAICFKVYVTGNDDATYCDEPGVQLLDTWSISVPLTYDNDRPISFTFTFGKLLLTMLKLEKNLKLLF